MMSHLASPLTVALAFACLLGACERRQATAPIPAPAPGFLKGQLHLHTSHSADSATPPEDVARWYEAHGYDFIVFTDHEHVTVAPQAGRLLALPGVELTQNLETCEPAPEPGLGCLLHVNALFVRPTSQTAPPWGPLRSRTRLHLFGRALGTTRALGGLAQLNHPNFHYAANAALVADLARRGLRLLEVANEAVDSNNAGDARHPSTEALWDAVLASGHLVWGTASDDAHHYDDAPSVTARGEVAHTGDRGFVMVQAARDPTSIRAAIEAGRFYASSGVLLGRAEVGPRAIEIEVAAASPGEHQITLVGAFGRPLARVTGRRARFALAGLPTGYVRAVVQDSIGRRAWLQPIWAGHSAVAPNIHLGPPRAAWWTASPNRRTSS